MPQLCTSGSSCFSLLSPHPLVKRQSGDGGGFVWGHAINFCSQLKLTFHIMSGIRVRAAQADSWTCRGSEMKSGYEKKFVLICAELLGRGFVRSLCFNLGAENTKGPENRGLPGAELSHFRSLRQNCIMGPHWLSASPLCCIYIHTRHSACGSFIIFVPRVIFNPTSAAALKHRPTSCLACCSGLLVIWLNANLFRKSVHHVGTKLTRIMKVFKLGATSAENKVKHEPFDQAKTLEARSGAACVSVSTGLYFSVAYSQTN